MIGSVSYICVSFVSAYRSKEMLLEDKFLIAHMSDAVRTALLWKKGTGPVIAMIVMTITVIT